VQSALIPLILVESVLIAAWTALLRRTRLA